MTPYLGCESARALLDAFVDGELIMAEQVAVESHLRWCATCRARVEDLRLIGASLRLGSPAAPHEVEDAPQLAALQAGVLSRIDAEHDQSLPVRVRSMFDDMRLFWPAVGATTALAACLSVALGVFQAATEQNPQSLSAMLERAGRPPAPVLPPANPGSDQNPMRLDGRVLFPRGFDSIPALETNHEDEVAFAVAAVINRDGRIANYDLLQAERSATRRGAATRAVDDRTAVLDVVKGTRFTPAEAAGGTKVAVNMVWLLVRTTARVARVTARPPAPALDPVKPQEPESSIPVSDAAPETPPPTSTTA
jgi:hypothetical protein